MRVTMTRLRGTPTQSGDPINEAKTTPKQRQFAGMVCEGESVTTQPRHNARRAKLAPTYEMTTASIAVARVQRQLQSRCLASAVVPATRCGCGQLLLVVLEGRHANWAMHRRLHTHSGGSHGQV